MICDKYQCEQEAVQHTNDGAHYCEKHKRHYRKVPTEPKEIIDQAISDIEKRL